MLTRISSLTLSQCKLLLIKTNILAAVHRRILFYFANTDKYNVYSSETYYNILLKDTITLLYHSF